MDAPNYKEMYSLALAAFSTNANVEIVINRCEGGRAVVDHMGIYWLALWKKGDFGDSPHYVANYASTSVPVSPPIVLVVPKITLPAMYAGKIALIRWCSLFPNCSISSVAVFQQSKPPSIFYLNQNRYDLYPIYFQSQKNTLRNLSLICRKSIPI